MSTKLQLIGTGFKENSRFIDISCILFVLCHKMPVSIASALVFPLLMIDQHNTFSFGNRLPYKSQDLSIENILYSHCCMPKKAFFPFLTLEQHTTFKESMINRLSNLINRNRLVAKISQVLCSSTKSMLKFYLVCVFFTFCLCLSLSVKNQQWPNPGLVKNKRLTFPLGGGQTISSSLYTLLVNQL